MTFECFPFKQLIRRVSANNDIEDEIHNRKKVIVPQLPFLVLVLNKLSTWFQSKVSILIDNSQSSYIFTTSVLTLIIEFLYYCLLERSQDDRWNECNMWKIPTFTRAKQKSQRLWVGDGNIWESTHCNGWCISKFSCSIGTVNFIDAWSFFQPSLNLSRHFRHHLSLMRNLWGTKAYL